MFLSLFALFLVMIATGASFHITVVLLPLVLIYLLVFCIGIGLLLSVGVVYFRDIEHLYGVFLTAFNYLTPIFYPFSMLPDWLKNLMVFNPLYNYIEMFRNIMLYGKWPTLTEHLICLAFSLGALFIGAEVFKHHQKNFILHI
jgi:ABC-type polysaccharide/polyol phosphate export permease